MTRQRRWLASAALAAALALPACAEVPSDSHEIHEPATLTPIEGTDLQQVTLEQSAADRLGIETDVVMRRGNFLAVPPGALMVDSEGTYWVYTSPGPLVFMRSQVTVAREEDDIVLLDDGPPAGTAVATVGVAELYGTETEVGH